MRPSGDPLSAMARSQLVFEDAGILSVLWDRKLGTVLLLIVLYMFYDGIVGARRASQKVT